MQCVLIIFSSLFSSVRTQIPPLSSFQSLTEDTVWQQVSFGFHSLHLDTERLGVLTFINPSSLIWIL